jgi:DNA-binding Lrp family transcriptional regulator
MYTNTVLIQRTLVPTLLAALKEATLLRVKGAARSGKTQLAAQLQARLAPGCLTLNARRADALALLSRAFEPPARPYIVCDDADYGFARLVAERQAAQAAAGLGAKPTRAILLGGDVAGGEGFGESDSFELRPFSLFELGAGSWRKHWFRGGLPEAYFAGSDAEAMDTLRDYAADLASSLASRRRDGLSRQGAHLLLKVLASSQGRPCSENALALSLGISRASVARAVARLRELGMLRRLEAYDEERTTLAGGHRRKRAGPLLYLRDQGLAHAILGMQDSADQATHGAATAAGWQAYVIEQAAAALPPGAWLRHYASADGAALEAVIDREGQAPIAASIRRHPGAAAPRGAANAADRLGIAQRVLVCPEGRGRELSRGFTEMSLPRFLELIEAL